MNAREEKYAQAIGCFCCVGWRDMLITKIWGSRSNHRFLLFFSLPQFPYSAIGDFLDPNIRVLRGPYCILSEVENVCLKHLEETPIKLIFRCEAHLHIQSIQICAFHKNFCCRYKHTVFAYMSLNDIDGLAQDCSNSIANALESLQSFPKPLDTCI